MSKITKIIITLVIMTLLIGGTILTNGFLIIILGLLLALLALGVAIHKWLSEIFD